MKSRDLVLQVAWSYIGTPYLWGGDDPSGFDCSGFAIECLKSCGSLPREGDWTASGLYQRFEKIDRDQVEGGDLVFWGNMDKSKIIHVEICIDRIYAIGASGGGSKTLTISDAFKQNAYIKVRPIDSRHNLWGFVNPYS